jgi:hypothetical protein
MPTTEKKIRNYALHLAHHVRRRNGRLILLQRYGHRQQVGSFRTWAEVNRALEALTYPDIEAMTKVEERKPFRQRWVAKR